MCLYKWRAICTAKAVNHLSAIAFIKLSVSIKWDWGNTNFLGKLTECKQRGILLLVAIQAEEKQLTFFPEVKREEK